MTATVRIGELAARTGVSVRSLRYYEEQGLLTSLRTPSGHRRYLETQVERIFFIQRLFSAGLSSRTIVDLLPCVESPNTDTSEAALERMHQERDRLDRHIEDLIRTRSVLDELIAANRAHRTELVSA
ncbi:MULTISPECIES: MerR family transcriptional regulator [Micromonospora]|uniref:DNA-binding transcriptional regulator, MerR family n=1 Tax=Micromonospora yangpuensis TaxID=683228 RepID=A0A1C6UJM4_9ACTN|nr:MerR family transcriptional regulator [Micromonospora yangpuensis]GGM30784.1 MerR family transcriptional regulator [Micromonospora yangpuensis]SCL54192.1 DNA-binding transcriptional regulator, MerR family [Micromonospora yangpuensis]